MKTLLLFVALSVLAPLIASRIRLPAAVALIAAGILAGPLGLGVLRENEVIAFVAQFGFLILMFIAGLEIDFAELRVLGLRALRAPTLTALGAIALSVALGAALHLSVARVLVLSAMSLGMPIAVLQETRTLKTPLGRHVLLTASVGEFFAILAITGWQITVRVGVGLRLAREVALVVLVFVLSAVAIRWARALLWWYPKAFERAASDHDTAEIGVRAGLFIMLAFVVFVHLFGVEAILGAFIGGTLVSFVLKEKHSLERKVSALGHGLFIPVFFMLVGVRFDPRALDLGAVRQAAALVAMAFAVKLAPALLFAPRGLPLRERFAAGALLSAPLTLVVAIGAVGRELNAVSPQEAASFILVALVLSVVFPGVYRVLVRGQAASEDARVATPNG